MKQPARSVQIVLWVVVAVALVMAGRSVWRKRQDSRMIDAVRHGDAQTVRQLLVSGVSPRLTWHGKTLMELAFNPMDADDPVPWRSSPEIARLLVDAGGDVNTQAGSGRPPLVSAAWSGDLLLVQAMLRHGAAPDQFAADMTGTALCGAAERGNLEIVNALLQAGANPNVSSKDTAAANAHFSTPLNSAILHKSLPVVKRLVQTGADVNLLDGAGTSALMLAVMNQDTAAVRLLLEHGADPHPPHPKSSSLMRQAEAYRRLPRGEEIYRLLLKHGGKPDPPPSASFSPER